MTFSIYLKTQMFVTLLMTLLPMSAAHPYLILNNLESDTTSAIMWFEYNYMKLNEEKCHILFASNTPEQMWVTVGQTKIWESRQERLLGLIIDKNHTTFGTYL